MADKDCYISYLDFYFLSKNIYTLTDIIFGNFYFSTNISLNWKK